MITLCVFLFKSTLVLGLVLVVCRYCSWLKLSAAQRHSLLVLAMLSLPMFILLNQLPKTAATFQPPPMLVALDLITLAATAAPELPPSTVGANASWHLKDLLQWFYLAVSLILVALWLVRWLRTAWWFRRSHGQPLMHASACGVQLRQSNRVSAPVTWGLVQPEILLPSQWHGWSEAKRRSVVAHEMAHVQRRDTMVSSVCALLGCFFWFQPLVWTVMRRLALEAEQACDDQVIIQGAAPFAYAEQLVEIARDQKMNAALAMAAPHTLPARVRALLDESTRRQIMTIRHWLFALGATLLVVLPLSAINASTTTPIAPEFSSDAGLLPLVKVSPVYPAQALAEGIAGFVELEFTVDDKGRTTDAKVIESMPAKIFDDAALRALTHYRYKPEVKNGLPIAVTGVRVRMAFGQQKGGSAERQKLVKTPDLSSAVFKKLTLVQNHIEAQEYSAAEGLLLELKAALKTMNPNERGQVHNLAGYLAFKEDDIWAALTDYEQVLAQGESIPKGLRIVTLYTVAQLNFVVQEYEASLRNIDQWMHEAENPGPIPLVFMGQVFYQLKDYPAAITKMEAGIHMAQQRDVEIKENWWALLNYLYYEQERWNDVIRVLEILNRDFPKAEYASRLAGVRGMLAGE